MEGKKIGLSEAAYNPKPGEKYIPFIPANKVMPEFTVTSIVLGILISVMFGAANAYLGLKVGLTVSASIPAAVISMGIIRGVLKKESILENNMVQTIGSAGESLAAGSIFTLPALFLWSKELGTQPPSMLKMTTIALIGGLLGVLLMTPLRKALIVKEHGVLPYPEGTACAEVLVAGEVGGSKASTVFIGLGIGAAYKFIADGIKLFPAEIDWNIKGYDGAVVGANILPALLGVGFIIGPNIAAYMLSGAVIGWLVLIPLFTKIGMTASFIMPPASVPIAELGPSGIWSSYIRYIGAGAVAFGGILSLIKSLPLIITTFSEAMKSMSQDNSHSIERTDQDLSMKTVIIGTVFIILAIMFSPAIPVGISGAIIIAIFGFFFATVSSRIVGLIGSSSNPVSGMTIATLLITAIIYKLMGKTDINGMIAVVSIGAVICIVAAMAGDMSQDLKTGYLVGATPRKQQIGEVIGAVAAALAIGAVLVLLDTAFGFGSKDLAAPQATLMKLVVEGVMKGNLPWALVFMGAGLGLAVELLKIPVLPFAVGLYLPIHLSVAIMVGGFLRGIIDKKQAKAEANKDEKQRHLFKEKIEGGILYSSGLIAGEGLVGILLAVLAVIETSPGNSILSQIGIGNLALGKYGGLILFILLALHLLKNSLWKKIEE